MSSGVDDSTIPDATLENNSENQDKIKFTKNEQKALKSFKPTKIIGFPQRRVDLIFYNEDNKPSGIIQIKKRKPEHLITKIQPKGKKNPDKKILASIGQYPICSQIYTYSNNDSYVYVHKGADFVKLDREEFFFLLSQVIGVLDTDPEFKNDLMLASIALDIKRYKRPHMRVKATGIKELSLSSIQAEFDQESKEKNETWK